MLSGHRPEASLQAINLMNSILLPLPPICKPLLPSVKRCGTKKKLLEGTNKRIAKVGLRIDCLHRHYSSPPGRPSALLRLSPPFPRLLLLAPLAAPLGGIFRDGGVVNRTGRLQEKNRISN